MPSSPCPPTLAAERGWGSGHSQGWVSPLGHFCTELPATLCPGWLIPSQQNHQLTHLGRTQDIRGQGPTSGFKVLPGGLIVMGELLQTETEDAIQVVLGVLN